MFTRKDYLNGVCSHNDYYAQFVNRRLVKFVEERIGKNIIKASTDPHFNDIKLIKWDALNQGIISCINKELFKKCNNVTYSEESKNSFLWSLSDGVCIAKATARKILINDYVISCIMNEDDANFEEKTISEKLYFCHGRFLDEYWHAYNQREYKGNQRKAFASFISGMPSCFNVDYLTENILNLAEKWKSNLKTEEEEDKFVENFFQTVSNAFFDMVEE